MSARVAVAALVPMVLLGLAASESHARGPRQRHTVPVPSYPSPRTIYHPPPIHPSQPTMRDLMPQFSPNNGYRFPPMIGIPQLPPQPPLTLRVEPITSKDRGTINGGRLIFNEGARRIDLEGKKNSGSIKVHVPLDILK